MLVTDGAVDTYDAIFAKYNWPERKVGAAWTKFCVCCILFHKEMYFNAVLKIN